MSEAGYPPAGPGPGSKVVGPYSTGLLLVQVAVAGYMVWALIDLLVQTPLGAVSSDGKTTAAHEVALLRLMAFSGALGAQLHGLRSYVWYVGNRNG